MYTYKRAHLRSAKMSNTVKVKEMLANYMTMHMDVDNVSDAALKEEGAKVRAQLRDMMGQEAFDIMLAVLHNPSCEVIDMPQD